jgi:hypothetical protein
MPDWVDVVISLIVLAALGASIADYYEPAVILTVLISCMWFGGVVPMWRERRRERD